jgi:formylglycine-generating enzyme required for sulfatase activity
VQWDEGQSGDQSTTPIDTYPHAASPYGVVDMVGNVEEWTSTISDEDQFPYPYVATDGREDMEKHDEFRFRRLRGGCWLLKPPMARAAARDFFDVEDRFDWLHGVRLVCTETP